MPLSKPASQPVQYGAQNLKSHGITIDPLGLVHKTLESEFRKNDTISMRSVRSPSSIERNDFLKIRDTSCTKMLVLVLEFLSQRCVLENLSIGGDAF